LSLIRIGRSIGLFKGLLFMSTYMKDSRRSMPGAVGQQMSVTQPKEALGNRHQHLTCLFP
jgi:hypothetical protein